VKSVRILGIGAVAIVGIAVVLLLSERSEPQYNMATVTKGTIVSEVTATGTVTPVGEVKVGSQISGQISDLLVDFNDAVRRGEPLAKLDSSIQAARVREARATVEIAEADVLIKQAALKRAEADVANDRSQLAAAEARIAETRAMRNQAKLDLDRKTTLAKKNTVSQSVLNQSQSAYQSAAAALRAKALDKEAQESAVLGAEAQRASAEAELEHAKAVVRREQAALEQAEEELRRTVIRSPIDGVVIGRDIETGQTVATTLEAPTLFTLAEDLWRMEVHAVIDEADIGRIRGGQAATFTVDAYPDHNFAGEVVQIRMASEELQGVVTYTVVITADNPDLALLPGMTAVVSIIVDEVTDILIVPNTALRFRPSMPAGAAPSSGTGAVVWVVDGQGGLVPVPLQTGHSDAISTEVVTGTLDVGDEVVVGQAVTVDHGRFGRWLGL